MLEIFLYRPEIRFFLAPHCGILKKFLFPLKITLIHLKTGTLKAPQRKQADELGIPGFTLICNLPSEFFVSLTKFLHLLWEPAISAELPIFLSPTGGGLFLSPQKLSQGTADITWLQVRVPLERSTAPVLHVWVQMRWHLLTGQARPHLGRSTPHFGFQRREPGHSAPALLLSYTCSPSCTWGWWWSCSVSPWQVRVGWPG